MRWLGRRVLWDRFRRRLGCELRCDVKGILLVAMSLVALGQEIKDPAGLNPVVVSSRAQMVALVERASVRIGDPIKLHFRLKNVSSGVIKYSGSGFTDDYWLMVTDPSGVQLPRTEKGDRMRRRSVSQGPSISGGLSPGEEEGDSAIDVSELYRLDRPGNYFVRIVRRIGAADPTDPRLMSGDQKVANQIPIEEAVSDLVPFTITP
jgi:hypothetical protein